MFCQFCWATILVFYMVLFDLVSPRSFTSFYLLARSYWYRCLLVWCSELDGTLLFCLVNFVIWLGSCMVSGGGSSPYFRRLCCVGLLFTKVISIFTALLKPFLAPFLSVLLMLRFDLIIETDCWIYFEVFGRFVHRMISSLLLGGWWGGGGWHLGELIFNGGFAGGFNLKFWRIISLGRRKDTFVVVFRLVYIPFVVF